MATLAHFLAAHAIALMMLSVGLRTDQAIVRDLKTRWPLLLRALAAVWVAVPLFALLVVHVVRPDPASAAVLVILAICPGVPLVLSKSRRARGDPRTSLLVLISTALTAIVVVPIWSAVLSLPIRPLEVARVVLAMVLLPFVIGRGINELAPRVAAPLAAVAHWLFLAGLVLLALGAMKLGAPALRELNARDIVAAVVIPVGAVAVGALAAWKPRPQRISVGFAAALGNTALALAVVANAPASVSLIIAFVVLRALVLIAPTLVFRR
jgi:bile acid:Na+ symporter, BASS family